MSLYETKYCPRCSEPFICKQGNITQCQCFTVPIGGRVIQLIGELYEGCLCVNCLIELRDKINEFDEDVKLDYILKHIDLNKNEKG